MTETQEQKDIIKNRIQYLRDAIAYSRYEHKIMTIGEGILCNYEIACWCRVLDGDGKRPKYRVTEAIEAKVAQINEQIKTRRWKRPLI